MSQVSTALCPSSTPGPDQPPERRLVETDPAIRQALAMVARYEGWPKLGPGPLAVAQSIVETGMTVAPTPVSRRWVRYSLSVAGGLARWADATGQPLTVEHLLSAEVRARFVFVAKAGMGTQSQASYRSRLEAFAVGHQLAESGHDVVVRLPRAGYLEPLTVTDEDDLWAWASGLRPWKRRAAMQAIVAFGLGTGLTPTDAMPVRVRDVAESASGVQVDVAAHADTAARVVTCRRDWEDRLAALARVTEPDNVVLAPWRSTPSTPQAMDQMRFTAQRYSPSPVAWTPARLRSTWLVWHLRAGTPIKTLLPAAGLTTVATLGQILPHLPEPDSAEAAAHMRGRVR